MNRLGGALLADMPILSVDEIIARVDGVTMDAVRGLAADLFQPASLSAAGIGPDEDAFRAALEPIGQMEGTVSAANGPA